MKINWNYKMRAMSRGMFTLVITICSLQLAVSQKDVTGTVNDSEGNPIFGATVVVKGTQIGDITDLEGKYNIKVPEEGAVLVYSYISMVTKEVTYSGESIVDVVMTENSNKLNEIVVIGYQTVRREDLTGAVSSIKDSVINKSKTPNLFDAIQGRIAGVNITSQSGEPGSGVNFNVRGSNSVFSAGSPLFIIDGVQLDLNAEEVASSGVGSVAPQDPLATINPQDIESIDVLKDASATAIYGSRGANGVIIITTKGGEKGKLTFEYTGSIGFARPTNTIDVISPEEYLLYREARDPTNAFTNLADGTPRDFSNIESNNWQDEALRTAVINNHSISARGGTDKTNYAASVGFIDQEGVIIENDYRKYNFRLKATHKQNDKLKFGFNLNTAFTELDGVANSGSGGDEFNGVVQFLVIANPWELLDITEEEQASQEYLSPLSLIEQGEKKIRFNRTFGSAFAEYNFTDDLKLRSFIGGNFSNSKLQEFHSSESRFGQRWNGRAVIRQVESYSYNFSNTLRYIKRFKKHYFNLIAGNELAKYNRESFFNDIVNFENQAVGFNDISIGQIFRGYGTERTPNNRISYFTSLNYVFKGKYLATFNFRADGSDRFPKGNRFGYFPGAALAWRLHREPFIKNIGAINELKIRTSYGQTGNERTPPFSFAARLDNAYYASDNQLNFGLAPGSLPNPDLKWETTTQYDVGLDLGLFNDRIHVTFDYYKKLTEDMLIDVPVPAQSGFNSQWQNLGAIENEGVEFTLSTLNIDTPNFKWSTDFNISINRNKVRDLGSIEFIPTGIPSGFITNAGRVIVGEPIGTMYGYVFDGIHQEGNAEGATPGTLRYKDLNGDGVIDDENDRTIIGDSNPKHIGGINNSFSYKNFNFSFFWQWSYGNDVFNAARLRTNGLQPFMNLTRDYYENAWSPENPSNVAPGYGQIEAVSSSYFVEDASFLRLKTVTLSYDLPQSLVSKTQLSGLRLFISGNNLLTLTEYTGFDPEVSSRNPLLRGFERFSYPRSATITTGFNLTF